MLNIKKKAIIIIAMFFVFIFVIILMALGGNNLLMTGNELKYLYEVIETEANTNIIEIIKQEEGKEPEFNVITGSNIPKSDLENNTVKSFYYKQIKFNFNNTYSNKQNIIFKQIAFKIKSDSNCNDFKIKVQLNEELAEEQTINLTAGESYHIYFNFTESMESVSAIKFINNSELSKATFIKWTVEDVQCSFER